MFPVSLKRGILLDDPQHLGKNVLIRGLAKQLLKEGHERLVFCPDGFSCRRRSILDRFRHSYFLGTSYRVSVAVKPEGTALHVQYHLWAPPIVLILLGQAGLFFIALSPVSMPGALCVAAIVFGLPVGAITFGIDVAFQRLVHKTWQKIQNRARYVGDKA